MTDLIEFLQARLDEDYRAADLVLRPYGDATPSNDAAWWADEREWFKASFSSDETPLLTRMTPQRVLAEVEMKRRMIEMHHDPEKFTDEEEAGWGGQYKGDCPNCRWWQPCPTLALLSVTYRDHPDFDASWLPSWLESSRG